MKDKNIFVYLIISAVAILFQLITLENQVAWIDEVMFTDSSVNALHGIGWVSHAWWGFPVSVYPPLYQFTLYGWISLFGFSLFSVRSLNIVLAFILGILLQRLLKNIGVNMNAWKTLFFGLLFWFSVDFSWLFRNGRPDILGATIATCLILLWIRWQNYFSSSKKQQRILLTGIFLSTTALLLTGLQNIVFAGLVILFLLFIHDKRKQLLLPLSSFMCGIITGGALLLLWIWYIDAIDCLFSFVLKQTRSVNQIVTDTTITTETHIVERSFLQKIWGLYNYQSYLILMAIGAILTISQKNIKYFLPLIFISFIPLLMRMAGNFPSYYIWMAYLPALLFVFILMDKQENTWKYMILTAVSAMFIYNSLQQYTQRFDTADLKKMIRQSHIQKDDIVIAPFATLYEIMDMSDNVFFPGTFHLENLPGKPKYAITQEGNFYGCYEQTIDNYIHQYNYELIDSVSSPLTFRLYRLKE